MAKGKKRISVNAFEKVAKEQFPETVTEEWFGIEVTIKHSLPLKEMIMFVQEVVDACFTTDGTYVPEIMDFAIKSGVLTHYANFNLPENLEKQYWLIYSTNAFGMVSQYINQSQLQEMIEAANKKIEYMCDTDITATKAKLNDLCEAFEKMGEQFSTLFNNVSQDDVQRLIEAVGEAGVDEDKIVSAYIKGMKSIAGNTGSGNGN